jgi:hypothetical protein
MNAVVKAPTKNYLVINVPLERLRPGREINTTNCSLQSALRKKDHADVVYYNVPDAVDNVFLRHTSIAKVDKARLGEGDHPDMNDIYETDLPWAGFVTFSGSSRQFRSRFGLQVFTRIIKEYDGVLYTLCEGAMVETRPPVLIKTDKHDISASHVKLTIIDDTHPDVLKAMFRGTECPPKGMLNEMSAIGYEWRTDRFVSRKDLPYSELFCRIYGKFLTPPNGR